MKAKHFSTANPILMLFLDVSTWLSQLLMATNLKMSFKKQQQQPQQQQQQPQPQPQRNTNFEFHTTNCFLPDLFSLGIFYFFLNKVGLLNLLLK